MQYAWRSTAEKIKKRRGGEWGRIKNFSYDPETRLRLKGTKTTQKRKIDDKGKKKNTRWFLSVDKQNSNRKSDDGDNRYDFPRQNQSKKKNYI